MEEENAFQLSENAYHKLAMLNFQKNFVAKKHAGMVFPSDYFASQNNSNEQFEMFKSLLKWLFSLLDRDAKFISDYSDPISVCSNVIQELSSCGISVPSDVTPIKMKGGYGAEVCRVLNLILDKIMAAKGMTPRAPNFPRNKEKPQPANEVVDDVEEEVGSVNLDEPDERIDGIATEETATQHKRVIETDADPKEWYEECERVQSKLVISKINERNEWRRHVDMARGYSGSVNELTQQVYKSLEKISENIEKSLDKIIANQNTVNNAFSDHFVEIKQSSERKKEVDSKIKVYAAKIKELSEEYNGLNSKYEEIQRKINEHNESATNDEPLLKIKKTIDDLKTELTRMDLHIGVLSNSIMNKSLKDRNVHSHADSDKAKRNELDIDDNSIEELV
jgi:hypothetical protein